MEAFWAGFLGAAGVVAFAAAIVCLLAGAVFLVRIGREVVAWCAAAVRVLRRRTR